jgi:hypothetical protein
MPWNLGNDSLGKRLYLITCILALMEKDLWLRIMLSTPAARNVFATKNERGEDKVHANALHAKEIEYCKRDWGTRLPDADEECSLYMLIRRVCFTNLHKYAETMWPK